MSFTITTQTNTGTGTDATRYCEWCPGTLHVSGPCPKVKAIEYNQYGQTTRVEFFSNKEEDE